MNRFSSLNVVLGSQQFECHRAFAECASLYPTCISIQRMSGVIPIQRMCSPQQTREGSGVSHWPIRGSTRVNYFSKASGSTLYFESTLRFCWRGDSLGRRSSGKTGSRKAISSIRLSAHAVQHQLACNAPYNSQYMGRTTVRIFVVPIRQSAESSIAPLS